MHRPFVGLSLLFASLPAAALEVRVHPAEVVYAYEVDPARALSTVVLQNMAVVQPKDQPGELPSPWSPSRSRRCRTASPYRR
jgi:hypothetical protein